MVTRKDLIIAILGTFCLTSTLFMMMIPIRSQTGQIGNGTYDPWMDLNDDGVIDSTDLGMLGAAWGTTGEPINKTALLLELLAEVYSLNANVTALQQRVNALEANYSVTSLKLASGAIPFKSTFASYENATTETMTWIDMAGMSLTISVNRTSHLLIAFSTEAENTDWWSRIIIRALVGGVMAQPGVIDLTPIPWQYAGHSHVIDFMSYSYNFYQPWVSAGNYTVKIQWAVTGGKGYVRSRTLTVIALPS